MILNTLIRLAPKIATHKSTLEWDQQFHIETWLQKKQFLIESGGCDLPGIIPLLQYTYGQALPLLMPVTGSFMGQNACVPDYDTTLYLFGILYHINIVHLGGGYCVNFVYNWGLSNIAPYLANFRFRYSPSYPSFALNPVNPNNMDGIIHIDQDALRQVLQRKVNAGVNFVGFHNHYGGSRELIRQAKVEPYLKDLENLEIASKEAFDQRAAGEVFESSPLITFTDGTFNVLLL